MLTNKELGEFLENIRKQKKLTLRQVDYLSDVSFSHLSMIEKGSRKALPLTLKELYVPIPPSLEIDLLLITDVVPTP